MGDFATCNVCGLEPGFMCREHFVKEVADLRAQLAAVTAERDEARTEVVINAGTAMGLQEALRVERERAEKVVRLARDIEAESSPYCTPKVMWLREGLRDAIAAFDAAAGKGET